MALHLSPELEQQVTALAKGTGREPDAVLADLVDAGVQRYNARLAKIRAAIDDADASPDAPEGAFNRVRQRIGLPKR